MSPLKKSSLEKAIPKDTEGIIKQAEEILKNEEKEEIIQKKPVDQKKQTTIQVINDNDIDPLELKTG